MAPVSLPMLADSIAIAMPVADRTRAHAYYGPGGLGLETPGPIADDGVPEPLRVLLAPGLLLMLIPTGGFGWTVAGREVAAPGVVGCQLSVPFESPEGVDAFVERAHAAGAEIVTEPGETPWGYSATVADPDGHLMMLLVPLA